MHMWNSVVETFNVDLGGGAVDLMMPFFGTRNTSMIVYSMFMVHSSICGQIHRYYWNLCS